MNAASSIGSRCRRAAFSLPEVTMATGIVAAVALPLLAMLAGGGSMQSSARDREIAARLATEVRASLSPGTGGDWELLLPGGEAIPLPGEVGGTAWILACDAEGQALRPVDSGVWASGLRGGDSWYLMRMSLREVSSGQGGAAGNSLLDLELTVSSPAAAAEDARHEEVFRSRVARP